MKKIFILLIAPLLIFSCTDADEEAHVLQGERYLITINVTFPAGEIANDEYSQAAVWSDSYSTYPEISPSVALLGVIGSSTLSGNMLYLSQTGECPLPPGNYTLILTETKGGMPPYPATGKILFHEFSIIDENVSITVLADDTNWQDVICTPDHECTVQ